MTDRKTTSDTPDAAELATTRRNTLKATGSLGLGSLLQLGGGPEAYAMSDYKVPYYRVPESDLDSPGVVGRRVEITSGGSNYSAGDQLVDTGSSWQLINAGVESLSTEKTVTASAVADRNADGHAQDAAVGGNRAGGASVTKRPGKPVFGWIFDDGFESVYQFRDEIQSKGVQVGISIITEKVGTSGYMTWEQIRELVYDYGFEVFNHSTDETRMDNLTEEEIYDNIYGCHAELKKQGLEPRGMVWPGGVSGDDVGEGIASELYPVAYRASGTTLGNFPWDMGRNTFDTVTVSSLQSDIDSAVTNTRGMMFMGHKLISGTQSEEQGLEASIQKFKDIVDYIRNNGGYVRKPTDVLKEANAPMRWGDSRGGIEFRPSGQLKLLPAQGADILLPAAGNWIVRDAEKNSIFQVSENTDTGRFEKFLEVGSKLTAENTIYAEGGVRMKSTEPSGTFATNVMYFDDGTNTSDGSPGLRYSTDAGATWTDVN